MYVDKSTLPRNIFYAIKGEVPFVLDKSSDVHKDFDFGREDKRTLTNRANCLRALKSFPDVLVATCTVENKPVHLHFACATVYSLLRASSSSAAPESADSVPVKCLFTLHRIIGKLLGFNSKTESTKQYDCQALFKLNDNGFAELKRHYCANDTIRNSNTNENLSNSPTKNLCELPELHCWNLLPDGLSKSGSNLRQSYALIPVITSGTSRQYYFVQVLTKPIEILRHFSSHQKKDFLAKINRIISGVDSTSVAVESADNDNRFGCTRLDVEDVMLSTMLKLHCG